MSSDARYRPDLDGLRAAAILPVLLFHAHVPGFSGGYVGVDVFFVISGYLITGIIAREVAEHRFSLLRFYERRARRIVPALTVVVLAVLGAAALLYLPGDFEAVPLSALATALFASNLYFFSEVGYFQTDAATKPLLHSWSLGIEEQFYIGFPLLLLLVARHAPARMHAAVAGTAIVSLVLVIATQGDRSGFTFYLLPTRAWELMAGALLALGTIPAPSARPLREAVAAAGLCAIAIAVVAYSERTQFPGSAALLPVIGAAAVIHAAPGTWTGALLSCRPLVAIGLLSYSLYLWHWPLIVFGEYALDRRLTPIETVAVIAASFALAALSWRFVEQPFRNVAAIPRRTIFLGSAVALGGIVMLSAAMLPLGGWPSRFGPAVARMADARWDFSPDRTRCHDTATRARAPCVLGAPGAQPSALIWGDSHGVELAHALGRLAARQGRALIQHTQSSCPPVPGYTAPEVPECARVNAQLLAAIRADRRLRTIYLIGFWASPAYAGVDAGLSRLIAALLADGRQVVLIGPVPPNRFDVPRELARMARDGRLGAAEGRDRADVVAIERHMRAIAAPWHGRAFRYLSPVDALCDMPRCRIIAAGRPLYFDHHHLSATGAAWLLQRLTTGQPLPF